jgi:succinyl-diaminopimelate desuccinylase
MARRPVAGMMPIRPGEAASMRNDMTRLMADPAQLRPMLAGLGYDVRPLPNGEAALPSAAASEVTLMAPMHSRGELSVRDRSFIARHVTRCGTIVAVLHALRTGRARPALLFLTAPGPLPDDWPPGPVLSLEGGVVPRIWPGCFGSFDVTLRFIGQPVREGRPGSAVNAIEGAIPILDALSRLQPVVHARHRPYFDTRDAPLAPRLSVSAAHGGLRGSLLPSVFEIVVNRRYHPDEDPQAALTEIEDTVQRAIHPGLHLDLSVTARAPPVLDPQRGSLSREARALALGWRWPHEPFRTSTPLLPDFTAFGGLERADGNSESPTAATTLEEIRALASSLQAYLAGSDDPAVALSLRTP